MPRKHKIGLGYFPIDTDLFHNKKITALRRAYGATGIAVYLNILCRVYGNGYYYKFTSEEELLWDIAEEISNQGIRKVLVCVAGVIRHLIESGLIDKSYYERDLVITGKAMQEQYVVSTYKAKRKIVMDTYQLVDVFQVIHKNDVSSEEMPETSEEMQETSEIGTQRERERENESLSISQSAPCAQEKEKDELDRVEEEDLSECDDPDYVKAIKDKRKMKDLYNAGVLMSERQIESLCELLSPDELQHYIEVLKDCIKIGHRPKSAYNFILAMAKKDRKIKEDM